MTQLNYPQVRKIKGLIERREGKCRLFTQRRQQIGQQNDIPDTPLDQDFRDGFIIEKGKLNSKKKKVIEVIPQKV
jgi:hypothetical protein